MKKQEEILMLPLTGDEGKATLGIGNWGTIQVYLNPRFSADKPLPQPDFEAKLPKHTVQAIAREFAKALKTFECQCETGRD